MVVKGHETGGSPTPGSYLTPVYVSSPRPWISNNGTAVTLTYNAGDKYVKVKILMICDGTTISMEITFNNATWST